MHILIYIEKEKEKSLDLEVEGLGGVKHLAANIRNTIFNRFLHFICIVVL